MAGASDIPLLDVVLDDADWFGTVREPVNPGAVTSALSVPQDAAQRLLRAVIRFVVDIRAGASLELVWQQGASELLVDSGSVTLTCTTGLVTVGVLVRCDQLDKPALARVALGVGQPDRPSGLVMSAFSRVDAPDLIADLWSEALTAFAWEAVLELASRLVAQVGKDDAGRPLIPGGIAAGPQLIIFTPMARNDLSRIGG